MWGACDQIDRILFAKPESLAGRFPPAVSLLRLAVTLSCLPEQTFRS